jgi:hypothetical protein
MPLQKHWQHRGGQEHKILPTIQKFDSSDFSFEVTDTIFDLSLHTMAMSLYSLYSYESHLVGSAPGLHLALVNKFLSVVAFDSFGCRSSCCDSFNDMT